MNTQTGFITNCRILFPRRHAEDASEILNDQNIHRREY